MLDTSAALTHLTCESSSLESGSMITVVHSLSNISALLLCCRCHPEQVATSLKRSHKQRLCIYFTSWMLWLCTSTATWSAPLLFALCCCCRLLGDVASLCPMACRMQHAWPISYCNKASCDWQFRSLILYANSLKTLSLIPDFFLISQLQNINFFADLKKSFKTSVCVIVYKYIGRQIVPELTWKT